MIPTPNPRVPPVAFKRLQQLLLGLSCCLSAAAQAGEFTNHIGIKFVDIPAGSFFMGSCRPLIAQAAPAAVEATATCPSGAAIDPDAYEDETPQHAVRIKAFQLGRIEVTLGQFKRFIQETGQNQLLDEEFLKYNNAPGDFAPVVQVSWQDAQAFVHWLNATKPKSDRGVYRLPTEAEWEYAARAGSKTRYYFGDFSDKRVGQYAWYDKNAGDKPRPGGGKKPNAFGLYDMYGNVWEWTEDCWNAGYQGAPVDGSAWTGGDCKKRVVRGGSWFDVPIYLRSAVRFGDRADKRINFDGFRVARTLP